MTYASAGTILYMSVGSAKRTPSDDIADRLRERRKEIARRLGPEADELRAELKQIDAALKSYDHAKPKSRGKK